MDFKVFGLLIFFLRQHRLYIMSLGYSHVTNLFLVKCITPWLPVYNEHHTLQSEISAIHIIIIIIITIIIVVVVVVIIIIIIIVLVIVLVVIIIIIIIINGSIIVTLNRPWFWSPQRRATVINGTYVSTYFRPSIAPNIFIDNLNDVIRYQWRH